MIDLYHTRRTNFKKCAYYKRDESTEVGDMAVWVRERRPTGYFYAKKRSFQSQEKGAFVNVFEISRTSCTIETNDDIPDIEVNDIVSYSGSFWVVSSVQQLEHLKETEFSNGEHYTTILGLRKW